MFVLTDEEPPYPWPVKVRMPHPDKPGHYETQAFTAMFKRLPNDEAKRLRDEPDEADGDHALLRRVVVGWRDIEGPDRKPIEFSSEALDALLSKPHVTIALYRAYTDSIVGTAVEERRKGN